MSLRRFLGLSAPKFCRDCGGQIIHGTRTVHLGYDEETGAERTRTTKEWWCREGVSGKDIFSHSASFPYRQDGNR